MVVLIIKQNDAKINYFIDGIARSWLFFKYWAERRVVCAKVYAHLVFIRDKEVKYE